MQGLHHVAKKLIINGRPWLARVDVSTVLPLMFLSLYDGSCALAWPANAISIIMTSGSILLFMRFFTVGFVFMALRFRNGCLITQI